jgi:hypothetical protein
MDTTDLGLEIVRGDRPLSDVSRLGVSVSVTPLYFELDERPGLEHILPGVDDVATGFLAHLETESMLREWATVLVGTRFIDLSLLEEDPDGAVIAEGLWDVSAGGPLAPSVLRAVASVLSRRSHI